jgi:hypothetical protein
MPATSQGDRMTDTQRGKTPPSLDDVAAARRPTTARNTDSLAHLELVALFLDIEGTRWDLLGPAT